MQYIKVTFSTPVQSERDLLMAMLSEAGYNGFEEAEQGLYAYIDEEKYDPDELKTISGFTGSTYLTDVIPAQNWNEVWESNFEPVVVNDFCTVRAHFHNIQVTTPYEIVITPKMSFGTGHHATTRLMIGLMKDIDFRGKSVLDFGTGTGILAILAEKLGAREVLAIDNDEWPVVNTNENIGRNNCSRISVALASLEDIQTEHTDIILANINRNILLKYILNLSYILNINGKLLISGILVEDLEIMLQNAALAGFRCEEKHDENGWIAILFEKI